MTTTGTVFRIERFSIHDGPGIRTTVFLKGCLLRCSWCHSPESQSTKPEFMPAPGRCIACGACVAACPEHGIPAPGAAAPREVCRLCGTCVDACPTGARMLVGEQMTVASVVDVVERDRIFYDESGGGVTISGGEPLVQPDFVRAIVDDCRARAVHVAVDTSGFGDRAALDAIQPDLFLFDVKLVDDARHRAATGVSNRAILENLAAVAARRSSRHADVVVRFPLIPGVNDDDENVREMGRAVSSLRIPRIDVLPYHRAGMAKYERLGRRYPLRDIEPPSPDVVTHVVETLARFGLDVRVGGG